MAHGPLVVLYLPKLLWAKASVSTFHLATVVAFYLLLSYTYLVGLLQTNIVASLSLLFSPL